MSDDRVIPAAPHRLDVYLSPAVRTMRDDPTPGVETTLVVRLAADTDAEPTLAAVEGTDREVVKETQFGNLHVTLPEPAVAGVLDALPPAVTSVETVTSELSGDAGEDLDPDTPT